MVVKDKGVLFDFGRKIGAGHRAGREKKQLGIIGPKYHDKTKARNNAVAGTLTAKTLNYTTFTEINVSQTDLWKAINGLLGLTNDPATNRYYLGAPHPVFTEGSETERIPMLWADSIHMTPLDDHYCGANGEYSPGDGGNPQTLHFRTCRIRVMVAATIIELQRKENGRSDVTIAEAAEQLNVSERLVSHAVKVVSEGTEQDVKDIMSGKPVFEVEGHSLFCQDRAVLVTIHSFHRILSKKRLIFRFSHSTLSLIAVFSVKLP